MSVASPHPIALADRPVRLVTPDGAVHAWLECTADLVLHLRLNETPPPLRVGARVRLVDLDPILGSVQFLVEPATALRHGAPFDVLLRIRKVFVGSDEIDAARILRQLFPEHDLPPDSFEATPKGVIFTFGPTRRTTREMVAMALARRAPDVRAKAANDRARTDHGERAATSSVTAPATDRIHRKLLEGMEPLRARITLHRDGVPAPALVYQASRDGKRLVACIAGAPPAFGSRLDATVDVPTTGRIDRALLTTSVAWSAPADDAADLSVVVLRVSPQTDDAHRNAWTLYANRQQVRWYEERPPLAPAEPEAEQPAADVIRRTRRLAREAARGPQPWARVRSHPLAG